MNDDGEGDVLRAGRFDVLLQEGVELGIIFHLFDQLNLLLGGHNGEAVGLGVDGENVAVGDGFLHLPGKREAPLPNEGGVGEGDGRCGEKQKIDACTYKNEKGEAQNGQGWACGPVDQKEGGQE